jgi:anti-anti-sigma factor
LTGQEVETLMRVGKFKMDNILILKPTGRLDTESSPSLEDTIGEQINGGEKNVILDLSDVPYLSSQGLRVILTAAKLADAAGGKLVVSSPQDAVKTIFNITGVRQLIQIFSANPEAAQSFAEEASA